MIKIGDQVIISGNRRTSHKFINLTGKVINISRLGGWVSIFTNKNKLIIKIQMNALKLNNTFFRVSKHSAFKPYLHYN